MGQPRLIQTYLLDGTLESVKIIELSESNIKAFVIPRLKVQDIKNRGELKQPSLYFLISSDETDVYIGESENFFDRVRNHDQAKKFWDVAIAIISLSNTLGKSEVKYLESLTVEKAQEGSINVLNKTIPARNTIHEFKLHTLEKILNDSQLIIASEGYDILPGKHTDGQVWYCYSKKSEAKAVFRGEKFIVLAGSLIDKTYAPSWGREWPKALTEREEIFEKSGEDKVSTVRLIENVAFKSPNHAGSFVTGRSVNAWTTFKNKEGLTMNEVMRRGAK